LLLLHTVVVVLVDVGAVVVIVLVVVGVGAVVGYSVLAVFWCMFLLLLF
jgi:hypothetical protein